MGHWPMGHRPRAVLLVVAVVVVVLLLLLLAGAHLRHLDLSIPAVGGVVSHLVRQMLAEAHLVRVRVRVRVRCWRKRT